MRSAIDIRGSSPILANGICQAFICEQFLFRGVVEAQANVTFLKVDGVWHRLHLEPEVIFWRSGVPEPHPWDVPAEGWSYPHLDVGEAAGITGQKLLRYDMWSADHSVGVTFQFENGKSIHIDTIQDRGRYVVA
jgi:hypothetical protein